MKIYVGNLSRDITDAELAALAGKFGTLTSSNVARERNGDSKGFAFLQFGTSEEANAAIEGLNGSDAGGRILKVSPALNQAPVDPLGGRY
ncbi:MAG TPA: RNA-binding protein [Thermoanaerobaculia bacterium]|nr:RNA-binding protein [Thermoanaerobaculia bacterium]